MFLRVHLSVSILAAFILADVLAVLQVLWYYSLFYDRCCFVVFNVFPTEEAFLLYRCYSQLSSTFLKFFWRRHPDLNWG